MGRFARRFLAAVVFIVTTAGFASPALASAPPPETPPAGTYHVPAYRSQVATPHLVVCQPGARLTGLAQQLARECAYHDVQRAVDAVSARGTTIYVLPGTYHKVSVSGVDDLQIEGVGGPVVIANAGHDQVGVHADRADGFYLRSVIVRGFAEDGIRVTQTDGFVLDRVTGLANGSHGLLADVADHGLITDCAASGNGDAGIATQSASDQRGGRLSIEIRRCQAYGNLIGYAGTAGDSVYVHDNQFNGNSTGAMLDSSVQAYGMPQNHAMFVANRVFDNNADFYRGCKGNRCPRRAVPVGTGLLLAGGDENTYASNLVYDNWRFGVAQYWIPASRRGVTDPAKQRDTSHGNRYVGNLVGVTPSGTPAPNGLDFWWDEQGDQNCWESNASYAGAPHSDPAALPTCDRPSAGGPYAQQGNPAKTAVVTACAAYRPGKGEPAGCDWLHTPAKPGA